MKILNITITFRSARLLAGLACFAAWSVAAFADEDCLAEYNGLTLVSGEATVSFDTKALTYGLPDADDPIIAPGGSLTFFEHLTVGTVFYFDITDFGE